MTIKMAFNPLPWYLHTDGWHPERAPALPDILNAIKASGYDAVHAEIPSGSSPAAYLSLLADHALAPAPGYFQARFSDAAGHADIVESAKAIARDHAALGLDRIFLADQFGVVDARIAKPALGLEADPDRLQRIIDGIGQAATAMAAEGIVPCLHPHVGTWVETVDEADAVLAAIPQSVLLLGPDTGHITWAGADIAAYLTRHKGRIGAVHIKDMRRSVAAAIRSDGADYREAGARHIWTEPGRGDIDFDAVFQALDGFDGWFVVEVDVADQPTIEETARVAADWLRPRLEARG